MKNFNEYRETVTTFSKEINIELRKISWPNRSETIKSTIAVLTISGIFSLFLSLTDYVFSMIFGSILS
jgi:preprotein translocase subunit SecE